MVISLGDKPRSDCEQALTYNSLYTASVQKMLALSSPTRQLKLRANQEKASVFNSKNLSTVILYLDMDGLLTRKGKNMELKEMCQNKIIVIYNS